MTPAACLPVPVCQLLLESVLHRLLPQRHGAPERGEGLPSAPGPAPWPPGDGPLEGSRALQPLPRPSILLSFLSVCPCVLSLPVVPLSHPSVRPPVPLVPPQLLLLLSLTQSLERQLRAALVPLVALRLRLLLLSLRGFLLAARAKVRAGGSLATVWAVWLCCGWGTASIGCMRNRVSGAGGGRPAEAPRALGGAWAGWR